MKPPIICLMGPTASGKTNLAIELVQRIPCEIISVDSAMVYRGMDIGSAKPTADILQIAPHQLIDICDPADAYSAGEFRRDALAAIAACHARGKLPLLVGGTMLYFRVLQQGIASLPQADAQLRAQLTQQAQSEGWPSLHAELAKVDPEAALRIKQQDSQRIQRALEVFQLSGKTITAWQREDTNPLAAYEVHNFALMPDDRAVLHQRIADRFMQMLAMGFIEEVEKLYARGDLHEALPAVRSVGYKQIWDYLAGKLNKQEMPERAIIATRQLAKRQITWLRSWPALQIVTGVDEVKDCF